MSPDQLQAWMAVFSAATAIGSSLVDLIRNHAQQTLTSEEWTALAAAWHADRIEAAKNAGIDPVTGFQLQPSLPTLTTTPKVNNDLAG